MRKNIEKYIESVFFLEIRKILEKHPLIFLNLINILYKKKKVMFVYPNILIISFEYLSEIEKNIFKDLYKCLESSLAIKKKIIKKGYTFIHLRGKEVINFFQDENYFLFILITLFLEKNNINYEIICDGVIKVNNLIIKYKDIDSEYDLFITNNSNINNKNVIVYNFNNNEFEKNLLDKIRLNNTN